MKLFKSKIYPLFIALLFLNTSNAQTIDGYYNVLKKQGQQPATFVTKKLQKYDLIVFDDALHAAVEPFEFYTNYIRKQPHTLDYLFVEVFSITAQPLIDSFLQCEIKDTSILAGVFKMDFGLGWPYQTYLDLLLTVWKVNQHLEENQQIRVIGVDQPIYWESLHNRRDFNLFKQSLIARDYFMYSIIEKYMDGFSGTKKGFFLTNTRHAYKCIKNKDGQIYWNAGTFLHQWHPGKTYAIRFHNMILNIKSLKKNVTHGSMQGLDRLEYTWARMDNGLWDSAFARNQNLPVAIPLKNNVFGRHPYWGNHMNNVLAGQTMYNAYDAIIFLKPLEETQFSAHTKFYFTEAFKSELVHRINVIHGHNIDAFLHKNNVTSIEEYIEQLSEFVPEKQNPLIQ